MPPTCAAVRVTAASINPTATPAVIKLKSGSTTCIISSKPPPSAPRRLASGITTSSATTGAESLPRKPRPSNGCGTLRPFESRGTSQIVLASLASIGLLDQTYAVAWLADVTKLFCPVSLTF